MEGSNVSASIFVNINTESRRYLWKMFQARRIRRVISLNKALKHESFMKSYACRCSHRYQSVK